MDFSFDDHVLLSEEETDKRSPGAVDADGEGNDAEDGDGGGGVQPRATDPAKRVAPRVVRNPQPKLNPERLCGNRGIATLPKIFDNVKLKGKGHEKEDLDKVLKTLEHWSHRLFPKFAFDDALDRIEKLGAKKPVQSCLTKIRLDMISTWENDVVEDQDVARDDDDLLDDGARTTAMDDDRFDRLHASIFGDPSTSQSDVIATPHSASTVDRAGPPNETVTTPTLTNEQKTRMEENRILATERLRAARLRAIEARSGHADTNREPVTDQKSNSRSTTTGAVDSEPDARTRSPEVPEKMATATVEGDLLNEAEMLAMMEEDFEMPTDSNETLTIVPAAESETPMLVS